MLKTNIKINFDFKVIKRGFTKTVWFLGKRAFLSFIIFFFIALFVGGAIFYYYAFLAAAREPEVYVKAIKLDDKLYHDFFANYSQRRQIFREADLKVYSNPFYQGQEQLSD